MSATATSKSAVANGQPRLVVEGLRVCVADSDTRIVDDIGFTVHAGGVLGLVGESGSGKTSIALALLGHARRGLQLAGGTVQLDGEDLLAVAPAQLRLLRGSIVAYVPQDPISALNPALRVGTQLREVFRFHPEVAGGSDQQSQRLTEVLAEVGLDRVPHALDAYPHQLSGGQQQRAAIAMAFALRPRLIVLDEPTTGLDVSTQHQVLATVRDLCTIHSTSAIYVSHDLAVVGQLADRVVVLYSGQDMESGPTPSLFGKPNHPYTRGLLGAVPTFDHSSVPEGIDGHPPRPNRRPAGCPFGPRCRFVEDACRAGKIEAVSRDNDTRRVRCRRVDELAPAGVPRPGRGPITAAGTGPRPEGQPLLAASGLSARYGELEVLHGVALGVHPDECLAIVGESGSGKTTLARCIAGLHTDWSGEVTYGGERLPRSARGRDKRFLRAVQFVFQNPYSSLNPRKTIGQIVEQPLIEFGTGKSGSERRARVADVLSEVSLSPDFLRKFPDQLSGGERQRVAIARALAVRPQLLLCDEVTSALDVSVQATVIQVLRRLQAEHHLAIIFITHNLALVKSIAQHVVVLSQGRVVEAGTVDEVLERPRDPYTISLMEDIPRIADAVARETTPGAQVEPPERLTDLAKDRR